MGTRNLSSRKGAWRLAAFIGLLILACAAVSYLTVSWTMRKQVWRHDAPHGHAWLHEELGLSAAEAARIDVFEPEYREQRRRLEAEFEARISELARYLLENDDYSQEVTDAVHGIHTVHGQLQELAIRHYYEMLNALPPEKQDRLRELAGEALSKPL